jgi:hypothetical protein
MVTCRLEYREVRAPMYLESLVLAFRIFTLATVAWGGE